jgi:hypothetical protein
LAKKKSACGNYWDREDELKNRNNESESAQVDVARVIEDLRAGLLRVAALVVASKPEAERDTLSAQIAAGECDLEFVIRLGPNAESIIVATKKTGEPANYVGVLGTPKGAVVGKNASLN